MGKKLRRTLLPSIAFLLLITLLIPLAANAELAPEYRRNGECYLLIGEGPTWMRGIYRLNNPEKTKYFDPPKFLFMPTNSFGFSVDLNRNIYTFSEEISYGYRTLSTPLKRQVLDTVSADQSDYGWHAYIHYDHRSWGKNTTVYRVGPVNRNIRRNGSGAWPYFKSGGPGKKIPAQSGDVLPDIPGIPLKAYPGKNWYEIPNGSWYSSWVAKRTQYGRPYTYFYQVFGDREEGQPHYWKLYTWRPDNLNLDKPKYSSSKGNTVATSYDKRIARQIFAGCLDGCGGSSGSGSGVADPMYNDMAFMPPIKSQPARTYFYSRPQKKSGYEITLNGANYIPKKANPIIGLPDSLDTMWIGVSMRDVNTDYVYTLGNSVIRDWYKQITGSAGSMNIAAVAVSNQWNQEGGIIYAYDKAQQLLFKFVRKEKDGTPISSERYQVLKMNDILSKIGAKSNSPIDDIKADGFGSLFFALSHPSKNISDYDPRKNFKLNDAIYLHVPDWTVEEGKINGNLIFRQEYGKAVYERNIYDGSVKEIGKKNYAERHYNVSFSIAEKGMYELRDSGSLPHGNVEAILASWPSTIGNDDKKIDWRDFAYGSLGIFYDYNFGDPGKAQLSVINVPTPPQVHSLNGKSSYLDIIGPYTDIPLPDTINRNTNQKMGLISPAPKTLNPDQLYFYMVENYPLTDGAQNPNSQEDWDNDGRMGGFISSLVSPESSSKGGRVFYRWRTWMVEDCYGKMVSPAKASPKITPPTYPSSTGQNYYQYFYSPIPGKYILTCQVAYDWYDYDLLDFGDTIADLPKIKRTNAKAIPVSSVGFTLDSRASQLDRIIARPEFKFMAASRTAYLNDILPDNTYAAIPIVVSGSAPPNPDMYELARIQRCDDGGANNPKNDNHWYPKGSASQPSGGYHGIESGKTYHWRVDVASQSNLFFDISKSTNTSKNYVAKMLLDSKSPFFVNTKPNFVFENKLGDLAWDGDTISVSAYLEYKVPDGKGSFKIERYDWKQDGEPELIIKAEDKNKPIILTTNGDFPPTDPYDADMVITMTRWFTYEMQSYLPDGTYQMTSTIPKLMKIVAKTKLMIMDMEKPKILYAKTTPNNLFGNTGEALKAGVGPSGRKNPKDITFSMYDNNPWEAVDNVVGITNPTTYKNNYKWNRSLKNKAAPTSQYNLKPIFAKKLNRRALLTFESAKRITDPKKGPFGMYKKGMASDPEMGALDFSDYGPYAHQFAAPGTSHLIVTDQSSSYKNPVSGMNIYRAEIDYRMAISHIVLNQYNTIPKGYANNTDGYIIFADKAKTIKKDIKPYKFYLMLSDSSGNYLKVSDRDPKRPDDDTPIPLELNLVLNVKDTIPPIPSGVLHEKKNGSTSYFPVKSRLAQMDKKKPDYNYYAGNFVNSIFNEDPALVNTDLDLGVELAKNWLPDPNTDGKDGVEGYINKVKVPRRNYQALKSLGDGIVKNFSDGGLVAQIENGLSPNYIEDNVEFTIKPEVCDNAGEATAVLTYKYLDQMGDERPRTVNCKWTSNCETAIASSTTEDLGVFRASPNDYPLAIPVKIYAKDNSRDWDYYTSGQLSNPMDPWSDWTWNKPYFGKPVGNERTFRTTIPVYGSKLIIRTLDKGIRSR